MLVTEIYLIFISLIRYKGCLAAVLASAYNYEEGDEDATSDGGSSKGSFAYLDFVDGEADQDNNGSFGYTRSSLSSSFEESSDIDNSVDEAIGRKRNGNSKHRSSSASTGSLRPPNWGKKTKEREERARQRNRRRRYNICCELLISSAELLLLDRGVARGFLPMLSRILVPPARTKQSSLLVRGKLPINGQRRATTCHSAPSSPAERTRHSMPTMPPRSSLTIDDYETVELRTETGPPVEKEKAKNYETEEVDKDDVLRPFLESMTPGSGFRCLSMLLLQHLLASKVGYDARVRHVLKKLGVLVLVHDIGNDSVEQELLNGNGNQNIAGYMETLTHATRKFEALERSIARRLIRLSNTSPNQKAKQETSIVEKNKVKHVGLTKEAIMRGVKIGSVGIVAGTLFALTGGLAAPGESAELCFCISGQVTKQRFQQELLREWLPWQGRLQRLQLQ